MTWVLVGSDAIGFADGNAGHVYNLPSGAPAAGALDVLCVNSDTVVATPAGFTIAVQAVANQGSYIFYRIAAGSEGASVTVTTTGDFNCQVTWSRWTGANVLDVVASVQANASFTSSTPAIDTGVLAGTGELVIAFGAIHGAVTTAPTWSAGYTPLESVTQGTGGSTATGYTAYRTDAGTAAETPQVSWTTAAPDRYMLVVTFTPGGPPPAENVIEAENRLTGTPKATWDVSGAGDATIQGFATAMSVDQAGTINFKIHSPNAFSVDIYRLGYYGGDGARLITTVAGTITTQPSGSVDGTTLMADCANWTVSASWTVPADACPGIYVARPKRGDTSGASHIPFIVRDSSRKAPILIVTSDSTWQAYNQAGADPAAPLTGTSLYGNGTAASFSFNLGTRCKAVSYNRPWVTRQHLPQTFLFNAEYPLIRWCERNGYDVDYAACTDVDADPALLTGRNVVIVHGHSEYWSAGMRDALVAARDAGVHVLSLAGNEIFWRITYDVTQRTYSCWKDSMDGALNGTGVYGGTWQDTRAFNPDRRPPQALTGQFFKVNGIDERALVVTDTYKNHPVWRDTAVAVLGPGGSTSYANLLGFEWDEDRAHAERPATWIRLSESTYTVSNLISNEDGNDYTGSGEVTHHLGAYRAASGAVVVGAGTVQLAWGLDAVHDRTVTSEQDDIQQMVMNLLADMGVQCPDASRQATLVKPTAVSLDTYGFPGVGATAMAGHSLTAAGIKHATATTVAAAGTVIASAGIKTSTNAAATLAGVTVQTAGTKHILASCVMTVGVSTAARNIPTGPVLTNLGGTLVDEPRLGGRLI